MWNNFFKHVDIDPANAHILDGNAEDLEAECDAYEKKIAEAGGIELFVGGQSNTFQLPGPLGLLRLKSLRRFSAESSVLFDRILPELLKKKYT